MMVYFVVPGDPKGKDRPRFSRYSGTVYTPEPTHAYQELVREQYETMAHGLHFDDDEELVVYIAANFKIPKKVPKLKLAKMLDGEIRPKRVPDCDNVAKIILDALQPDKRHPDPIAFKDDKQVVKLVVEKYYAPTPFVAVYIASRTDYEAYGLGEVQDGGMD